MHHASIPAGLMAKARGKDLLGRIVATHAVATEVGLLPQSVACKTDIPGVKCSEPFMILREYFKQKKKGEPCCKAFWHACD